MLQEYECSGSPVWQQDGTRGSGLEGAYPNRSWRIYRSAEPAEACFLVVQWKLLTRNGFYSRKKFLIATWPYQSPYDQIAKPIEWKFTRPP